MAKKFTPGRKQTKAVLNKGIDALLGNRNLDAALAEAPAETVRTLSRDFSYLPINKISANPDQPRKEFEEAPLTELANSIKVHGIIQPLTVRHMGDGTFQIISGERRFRASQLAGLQEVPAFVRTANDQTLLEMALIENIQREDLNPMEVAYSYFRLAEDFDLTQQEVAYRVGKGRSTVTNHLAVLNTSPKVQQAVREKKISIGAAKTFASIKDIGQQEAFLDDIIAHPDWSVRRIEEEARSYKSKNKATPAKQPESDDMRTVREAFQRFFGTKQVRVSLDSKNAKSGSITLKFANQEQLEQFFKAVE